MTDKQDDLSLTDEEIYIIHEQVRDVCQGMTVSSHVDCAIKRSAKAQLVKAEPIIRKQERERILDRIEVIFSEEIFEVFPLRKYTVALLNLKRKKWTDFRQALKSE